MKKNRQAKIVEQLTDRQLLLNLYLSQSMFLFVAIIGIWIFFDSFRTFFQLFQWNPSQVFLYGIVPALLIVIVDIVLIKILPKRFFDDGGINERIFSMLSIPHIFLITFIIAVSEELLFRGLIHTEAGYIIASLVFALIHYRYLHKIVLLISVLLLSFLIGYMYEITQNLLVPIVAHFFIDLLLGIYYRLNMR
ncbi:CPBP family intramembrane metalloprotease [Halalkalibacillus sediminis]|uniref:CPBP family intramembrane metalloprotease n=1 Tax=Halalkalibacillus sediminis TaxID=2018042 RepID=A0A2I0QWZ9_9BACI|nr:CPBP family intramembrane glutamic endopeptidase [Halalkalibacillus sediminis]PKR78876.1 CPBP family intramembrane metalloprotease [Halalkalibacillus sediminis]